MKVFKKNLPGLIFLVMIGIVSSGMAETQTINRAVIKIDSLSCGGCFSTISAGLTSLEGYSGMGTNLFRKLIAVDFTAPLTAEEIAQKLAKVGYPGKLKYVDPISEKESFIYLESKRTGLNSDGGGGCCSSENPAVGSGNKSQNSILYSGGSCCALPETTGQPTEDL